MKAELLSLDKKIILKYLTEEQIFEKYFGHKPELNKLYTNEKLRVDETPGCSFYYRDNGKLILTDFSAGEQYDCFDYIMRLHCNCKFPVALEIIARDFGLLDRNKVVNKLLPKPIEKVSKIYNHIEICREKKFKKEHLEYWSIGGLKITQEILAANKIWALRHLWEHTPTKVNYYTPNQLGVAFAYHWEGYNYQIYFPFKKKELGERKFINPPKIKIGDIEFLDFNANHIVITKSKKDAFYLRLFGINAFFIINEAILLHENTMKIVNLFENRFTLFDNDRIGKRASLKYRKHYNTTALLYEKQDGKDTYDVIKKNGKQYFIDLLEDTRNKFNL